MKSTKTFPMILLSVLLLAAAGTVLAVDAPANTNLIANGGFDAGMNGWGTWNLQTQINGGVLEVARWANTPDGGLFQFVNFSVPAGAPLEFTFKMGNRSRVPKALNLILRTADWSDTRSCPFTLAANAPMQTYTMRFRTSAAWSPIVLQGWVTPGDSQLGLQMDNLHLQYRPSAAYPTSAECSVAPPTYANLVYNGDFSAPYSGTWDTWNSSAVTTSTGLFEITRNPATPTGGFYQWNPYSLPAGASFEVTLQLGNRSSVAKTINLVVRDPNWADMRNCWYTMQPYTGLQTITIRARTSIQWSNVIVQGWLQNPDGAMAWQLDNLSLTYRPDSAFGTLECGEPLLTPEQQMVALVNELRCQAGLVPLTINPQLTSAAALHSFDMAYNMVSYISHTGTNGSTPSVRTAAFGYPGTMIGENAAAGYSTVQAAFNGWRASAGHYAVMMHPDFRETGVSVLENPSGMFRYYWTQVFGTRGGAPSASCSLTGQQTMTPSALETGVLIEPFSAEGAPGPEAVSSVPSTPDVSAPPPVEEAAKP